MNTRRAIWMVFVMTGTLSLFGALEGRGEEGPKNLEAKPANVALLKSGLGFFTFEVVVPEPGEYVITGLPVPAHGTFWVNYPEKVTLESVTARIDRVKDEVEPTSVEEILRASVGKKVTLTVSSGDGLTTLEATIVSCPSRREEIPPEVVRFPGSPSYRPTDANVVILDTGSGLVVFNRGNIQRVWFAPGTEVPKLRCDTERAAVVLKVSGEAIETPIQITFLAKGASWAPAYAIDISEPEKAKVALQAVIVNDAGDFQGTNVDLVTGFPNFLFADVVSPLAMRETLEQFIGSLSRRRTEPSGRASVVTQQRVMSQGEAYYPGGPGVFPSYVAAALPGEQAEDFFFYKLENVNLKKNERLYRQVFTAEVPYRHIYEWTVPDFMGPENQYRETREETVPPVEVVWHSLLLENSTEMTWTTAPAETVQGRQILGQDILGYTPPRGKTSLKITQAPSVKAEQNEFETARERGVEEYYGTRYDRITLKGELKVTNFKKETIHLVVKKQTSGDVSAIEPEAKAEKMAKGLRAVNPKNLLTWEFDLAAGESKTLTYQTVVLIRP